MISEIKSERIPIKLWLDDIEDGTLIQVKNLANFPFAFRHIALMPDAHQGYGMPIGGVMATRGVIVPNAVGVDIGCGMCSVKTSLREINKDDLKKITGRIRQIIPVGFNHQKIEQDVKNMPVIDYEMPVVEREYRRALKQVGTLGGGNHFIEIQKGSEGYIWIMIHSGSRNLGKQVADNYNGIAKRLNEKYKKPVPKEWQLAYLDIGSDEGIKYLNEMTFCVDFALANRLLMMNRVMGIFLDNHHDIEFDDVINIAHNYAASENHFGSELIVHRKGATEASAGKIGIIPGSQGSKSYIISGKGNTDSFMSCSHGAGRKLGRKQAIRELDLNSEKMKLDRQGILHSIRGSRDLDEAPGAYKDIDTVMRNQDDLVDILVQLSPLSVIKG